MKKIKNVVTVVLMSALIGGGVLCAPRVVYGFSTGDNQDHTSAEAGDRYGGGCKATWSRCGSDPRRGMVATVKTLADVLNEPEVAGMNAAVKQQLVAEAQATGITDFSTYPVVLLQYANTVPIVQDGKVVGYRPTGTAVGLAEFGGMDAEGGVWANYEDIAGGISPAMLNAILELGKDVNFFTDFNKRGAEGFDAELLKLLEANPELLSKLLSEESVKVIQRPSTTKSNTAVYRSRTEIDALGGIPGGVIDSGWDGTVDIEFSTDEPTVSVRFTHTIDYSGFTMGESDVMTDEDSAGNAELNMETPDVSDTVNNHTPYYITTGGGGDFGVHNSAAATQSAGSTTQTVSLEVGETKTVCSYIMYDNKTANMFGVQHIQRKKKTTSSEGDGNDSDGGDEYEVVGVDHYDWYNSGYSGSGSSGACATIHRPANPTGEPKNPNNSGATDSDIMFAGGTANLQWDLHGNTHDTRRLVERQITAHLVDAVANNSSRFFIGNPRSSSDPYGYYSGANIVSRHNFGEEGANLNNNPDDYSGYFGVVVPDYTAYKYCHTGGYRYESWYSINGSWSHDTRTDKNWRNYWYVYNASCRTIAKKPSVAVWNSSFMTVGSVTTSASLRYDDATFGTRIEAGGSRTLFGSWSEYLAVVNKDVMYYTSGASFARGSRVLVVPKSGNPLETSNSPLTVSNSGRLGGSGIRNNSTYLTRLSAYLENSQQAVTLNSDVLGAMPNVSDTQILRRDGKLTITDNITINTNTVYSNIYQLPQVVIFVHGDLDIASNVTQLDAWLVVDGAINTCSDFIVSGSSGYGTESDAIGRESATCSKQLVFNGPVLANKVILNRSFGADPLVSRRGTFGDGPAKYNAGEVFNLRTDSYLWARAQASRYFSSYTESYSRELAPRY